MGRNSLFAGKNSHRRRCIIAMEVNDMDQIKIGKFIASLRRQAGLTQEALGEKIGVSNKTISRWENGNYMPDIEMLQLLSKEFDVNIHELLAGERISNEDFRQKADEQLIEAAKNGVFTFNERKAYFKKKWRKEHAALFVVLALIFIAACVLPFILNKPWLIGLAPLTALIEYGYQNNKMMTYVESFLSPFF